ncbi:MAG: S-layer homology domain-containing protein [Ruminococcaceae bacterium]|nr:S-layer homology domain-containing protein [Oscillospiraceae bacterium]
MLSDTIKATYLKGNKFMKRIIGILLAAILIIPSLTGAFAVEKSAGLAEDKIIKIVGALEIMQGDENGNLNLEKEVTRAEFVKMAISASQYKDEADVKPPYSIFPDVQSSHWASGYIKTAVSSGLVNGYLDGTFRPSGYVKLEEAVTVTLKLLGYSDSDFTGSYPDGQISKYRSLKIDTNISAKTGDILTRRECMYLLYNALCTYTKSGKGYGETLGYTADKYGNIDYLALMEKDKEGPYIVSGDDWIAKLGFDAADTEYYTDSKKVSQDVIKDNDVIYWSNSFKTVWVYSDKVTGVLEGISPNPASPSAVTVAGNSYDIETEQAKVAFGGKGSFEIGDTVTILLGESGIVAAKNPETVSDEFFGLSTSVERKEYTYGGKTYSDYYVNVSSFDGKTHSIKTEDPDFQTGILVRVNYSGGEMTAKPYSQKYNSVNDLILAVKEDRIAENAVIVDYFGKSYVTTYPARLKEISINAQNVAYYNINSNGFVDYLLLKDATGDCHSYGVIFKYKGNTSFLTSSKNSSISNYSNLSSGVVKVKYDGNEADNISWLPEMTIDSIDNGKVNFLGKTYKVWDYAECFVLEQKTYSANKSSDKSMSEIIEQVSFDRIDTILKGDEYTVMGYYDNTGIIRVLVAQKNF